MAVAEASNQSHRRASPARAADFDPALPKQSPAEFQYQELDPSVDCMRLVHFEPSEDPGPVVPIIRIKLIHVTFGERPKYLALSYMWGDETSRKKILVDGKEFMVGENLWDALQYLMKCDGAARYWIDAICINQADVAERNRQLRIMPHIYSRAQEVLVWLGRKYAVHDASYLAAWQMDILDLLPSCSGDDGVHTQSLWMQFDIVQQLCTDGYWDRLWIILEIGKARKIHICFGEKREMQVAWDVFIDKIKALSRRGLHCYGAERALKLAAEREERNQHGRTLRNLLESHQDAICKDPRDKIYGLIGLADDTRYFPMDYQKSPFEVWKDTMLFMNRKAELPGPDIVPFGRGLKRMLGPSIETADQIAQGHASQSETRCIREDLFQLPMSVAGMIMNVGPSPERLASVLDAEEDWRARLHQYFPGNCGVEALRDHELLMKELLDLEPDHAQVLSYPNLPFRWQANSLLQVAIEHSMAIKLRNELLMQTRSDKFHHSRAVDIDNTEPLLPTSRSCVYEIERISHRASRWKLGIATGDVQAGDFICLLLAVQKALVLRMEDGWLRIVGVTTEPKELRKKGHAWFFPKSEFAKGHEKESELGIDVETLNVLLG